jgi:hypothetical protein
MAYRQLIYTVLKRSQTEVINSYFTVGYTSLLQCFVEHLDYCEKFKHMKLESVYWCSACMLLKVLQVRVIARMSSAYSES